MSVKIPETYELEPTVNRKILAKRSYKAWTIADVKEFFAEFPDDATVWISRYDAEAGDIYLRPLESMAGSSGVHPYVTL